MNDSQSAKIHGPEVTLIEQPSNQPRENAVVTLGTVRLFPNPLSIDTYEARLTKGGTDPYIVEVNGKRLSAWEGLGALYAALVTERKVQK